MLKKTIAISLSICLIFLSYITAYAQNDTSETDYTDYIKIYDCTGLAAIAQDPSSNYVLMNDINMEGCDWCPLDFYGIFDGNNYTLFNLTISQMNDQPAITVDGNHKEYETFFASLFARTQGAVIKNLNLFNVDINIVTDKNCFAAGLVGFSENTEIIGCSVAGNIYLEMTNRMCGVSGIAGFGFGKVTDSRADVTMSLVDANQTINCEEFLGGVLACGYSDIEGCEVKVRGYTSVYGYVHNGGLVGMHHIHTSDRSRNGYVRNCTVDAKISFFEKVGSRRAYCKPYIGETLDAKNMTLSGNTTTEYERNEDFTYSTILLPEEVIAPQYTKEVIDPTCTEQGYTQYVYDTGEIFKDSYTEPSHIAGEWEVVAEPNYEDNGLQIKECIVCGQLLEEEEIPKLEYIYVSSCDLDESDLSLNYKSTGQLTVSVLPGNATNPDVVWTSSDNDIASVDENGLIKANGRGDAVITCEASDGTAASECNVSVRYTFGQWLIVIFLFGWIWY